MRQPQAKEPTMDIICIPVRVALLASDMPSVFTDYAFVA